MKDHFYEFDLNYNKDALKEIYDEYIHEFPAERNMRSPFRALSDNLDLSSHEDVAKIYEAVGPVPARPHFFTICELTKPVKPHINPRNNGTVFFPISGDVRVKFYGYPVPTDFDGRPTFSPMPDERPQLTPEQEKELQESVFHVIDVKKPVAINGLKLHSYEPMSLEPPVFCVVKIPLEVSWETLIDFIQQR